MIIFCLLLSLALWTVALITGGAWAASIRRLGSDDSLTKQYYRLATASFFSGLIAFLVALLLQ